MIRATVCLSTTVEKDGEAVEGRDAVIERDVSLRDALGTVAYEVRTPSSLPEFSSYPVSKGDWLIFYGEREEPDADEIGATLSLHLTPAPTLSSLKRLGRLLGAYGV